ncbi:MAG: nucleotidyltransferase domain-containing protein [archaeon]|nr:nucleotidyltransferase domain-containing protein [archaeon]
MNREREIVAKLKSILEEIGVEYSNILLFGSRTGKNFEEESDWDFLIVVKGNLGLKEKKELWHNIYRRFHEYFPFISIDIILKDERSFEDEKKVANTVSNEVYLEGIEV